MGIERIARIQNHRIFRDFTWPQDLPDFGRCNLVYGWNGTGKTTLSNLLSHLQSRTPVTPGTATFRIDGHAVDGSELATAAGLPEVRVFNRDFTARNVLSVSGDLEPIFYFGEDSVAKQQEIAALREQLKGLDSELATRQIEKAHLQVELDAFLVDNARAIKEMLRSSGASNPYSNYNKGHFETACSAAAAGTLAVTSLTNEQEAKLRQQKDANPRPKATEVAAQIGDIGALATQARELLARTATSQAVEPLAKDAPLSSWIQTGLRLHVERHRADCLFCGQSLLGDRIQQLERHFSDTFKSFMSSIESLVRDVVALERLLLGISLPAKSSFYDHLAQDFESASQQFDALLQQGIEVLKALVAALESKKLQPFDSLVLDANLKGLTIPTVSELQGALASVNQVVQKHNEHTENFVQTVADAKKALELAYVAERLGEYRDKVDRVSASTTGSTALAGQQTHVAGQIATLEKEIEEFRKPADELNTELARYLGQNELQFHVKGRGYSITRNGIAAKDLSEGEKTAIAFLYFLKSLQDKSFPLKESVVVIDDPVSSLDASSLFSAFGFLRARTKDAGQLFVLTHNFAFFQLVKNWFQHLDRHDRASRGLVRYYMVVCHPAAGGRTSTIKELDPLLKEHESEYHYLFKQVFEGSQPTDAPVPLEAYYGLPNMARRLLETFLAFRYPGLIQDDLAKKLNQLDFEADRLARIVRFINVHSHANEILDPQHDLSLLAEAPAVLGEILALMKSEDERHYHAMVVLVTAPG